MRSLDAEYKNAAYLVYRLIKPLVDPVKLFTGAFGYAWYLGDLISYKLRNHTSRLDLMDLFPVLDEKIKFTPFDSHYFYQQLWVFENILKTLPKEHLDVGSTYEMSGYLSKIVKTKFIDYRPVNVKLSNLEVEKGDVLNLSYKDNSVNSLSCLHVVEHIGLGRYGDPLDSLGTEKACSELARVLKRGGYLYLSTPIGRERICFNAHRIHRPETILRYCRGLKLIKFSVVDDYGRFCDGVNFRDYSSLHYGCGMFQLSK